jgi:hypothetical protein
MSELESIAVPEQLESLVVILRGQRVLLSPHLASLYGVEPRSLIQAVKRNPERFPADFMFQLTPAETESLRSQFVTANEADNETDDDFKSQSVIANSDVTEKTDNLKSQIVTSSSEPEGEPTELRSQTVIASSSMVRFAPYAFTEQGVAMLSSVLRSSRAVAVNIEIMRAFVRLRHLLAGNAELTQRLNELEASVKAGTDKSDQQFRVVFDAIRQLMTPPPPKQGRIGFRQEGAAE